MSSPWNTGSGMPVDEASPLRIHLFVSRNKDNAGVGGFSQRRRSRLARDSDLARIQALFDAFVAEGAAGETCRWYSSVNARDPEKVRKGLMHRLVDGADVAHVEGLAVSCAAKPQCAAEHRWLFDFDHPSPVLASEFTEDLRTAGGFDAVECNRTPNGYAVISPRGFDTRCLLQGRPRGGKGAWADIVTLKRDDLLCRAWKTNR